MNGNGHVPVLIQEVLDYLDITRKGLYIDCTLGLGGHALEILKKNPQANLIGFDIDEFSDNSITIRSVPEIAKSIDAEEVLCDFIESFKNETSNEFDIQKKVAATVACHSARRSGDKIDFDEMKILIDDAIINKYELRCPHGRPFIYKIEKSNFERMFKRY